MVKEIFPISCLQAVQMLKQWYYQTSITIRILLYPVNGYLMLQLMFALFADMLHLM